MIFLTRITNYFPINAGVQQIACLEQFVRFILPYRTTVPL